MSRLQKQLIICVSFCCFFINLPIRLEIPLLHCIIPAFFLYVHLFVFTFVHFVLSIGPLFGNMHSLLNLQQVSIFSFYFHCCFHPFFSLSLPFSVCILHFFACLSFSFSKLVCLSICPLIHFAGLFVHAFTPFVLSLITGSS